MSFFKFSTVAFGSTRREKSIFLAKAMIGSAVGGLVISNMILTDERMQRMTSATTKFGQSIGLVHQNAEAFSTADHGMHAPHYPWEFDKFYQTFDHQA